MSTLRSPTTSHRTRLTTRAVGAAALLALVAAGFVGLHQSAAHAVHSHRVVPMQ